MHHATSKRRCVLDTEGFPSQEKRDIIAEFTFDCFALRFTKIQGISQVLKEVTRKVSLQRKWIKRSRMISALVYHTARVLPYILLGA